jgi:cyclophilin family peptidyl-prolyl cis-trans isomerase
MPAAATPPPAAASTPPPTPAAPAPAPAPPAAPALQWSKPPAPQIDISAPYTANISTTDGNIGVQLLPSVAPNAVNNFVFLARKGFYHNVPIHRMIPDFMFQSGDPTGTGMGGPGYNIPDDKVPVGMSYSRGTLAMANTGDPNSGGSQFFIMLGDQDLPPTYPIFGKVVEGQDVLDKIAQTPTADNGFGELSKPTQPIQINDVTISGGP